MLPCAVMQGSRARTLGLAFPPQAETVLLCRMLLPSLGLTLLAVASPARLWPAQLAMLLQLLPLRCAPSERRVALASLGRLHKLATLTLWRLISRRATEIPCGALVER